MQYRELGRTGWRVSAISFGAWAIGSAWGSVDDRASLDALRRAVDLGVNFFDTADVYGDGRSERLLAQLKRERREETHIATKAGCRLETKHSPVSILNWDCKRLKNCARLYRRVGRWEFALRWILMFDPVTCAIPGAKRPTQVEENCRAADLPIISDATMQRVREIYNRHIREQVHHYW